MSREYRIAPELRRSCWYGLVGAVLLGGVFYGVTTFVQRRDSIGIAIGCVLFALLAVAMVRALRWKLLLDSQGMARRRFFRWDVWTWADLASGRIRKLHPYTLLDPTRPWLRRKLRLSYLAVDDIREVFAEINAHYQLPPPPKIPDSLNIKCGFCRRLTFDRNGVQLLVRGTPHVYLWHEIRSVRIVRMDPLRRDFHSLEIAFPDQEIKLMLVSTQYGTYPNWQGATSEEINEVLLHYLAPNQIDTSIADETPKKREDIEKKLKIAKYTQRQVVTVMAIGLPLIAGVLVWMAIDRNNIWGAVVMAAIVTILCGPLFMFVYRSNRKQIAELDGVLKRAVNDGSRGAKTGNSQAR